MRRYMMEPRVGKLGIAHLCNFRFNIQKMNVMLGLGSDIFGPEFTSRHFSKLNVTLTTGNLM